MPNRIHSDEKPHDEAEALLPWYATGQLDDDERERVEQHLLACSGCREQLGVERRMIGEFRRSTPELESGWARMRARIEAPSAASARAPRRRGLDEALLEFWSVLTRPVVAALAAAQLGFVAVASTLLIWLSQPAYHALGSSPAPASANMLVMFRDAATVEDVRDALQTASATIVGGPTSTGAYLIRVEPKQRRSALAKLQSNDDVQLAAEIDSGASK
jgi:anti-sigma factor RsiW